MADMIYRLVLKAQFENPEELQKAVAGLQQLQLQGANVNVKMSEFSGTQSNFAEGMARSFMRVGFMFNMMESAMMRLAFSQMMAANAQDRYNDAVMRYGANSEEAKRAARNLEIQTNMINSANLRANLSIGLVTTQLLLQSGILNKATLAHIAHAAAVSYTTVVEWAHVAALKAKAIWQAITSYGLAVPFMLAAGAAVAGLAYGAATGAFVPKSEVNIQSTVKVETDLDAALDQQNRQIKNEYKRMRP